MKSFEHKLLRAPHPHRFAVAARAHHERTIQSLSPAWRQSIDAFLANPSIPASTIVRTVFDSGDPDLLSWLEEEIMAAGGGVGAFARLTSLRFQRTQSPIFAYDPAVTAELAACEIAADVPVGLLRPPYPMTYFHFPWSSLTHPPYLPNDTSGRHRFEGAYLSLIEEDGVAFLEVMLTGSPHADATDPLDDAIFGLRLGLEDPNRSVAILLARCFDPSSPEYLPGLGHHPEWIKPVSECLMVLCGALLFLNVAQCRLVSRPGNIPSTAATKSSKKKAKQARQAERRYDFTLVTFHTEPSDATEAAVASGRRQLRPHWRRAHFRMQRHGEGGQRQRLIYVRATRVKGFVGTVPNYAVE